MGKKLVTESEYVLDFMILHNKAAVHAVNTAFQFSEQSFLLRTDSTDTACKQLAFIFRATTLKKVYILSAFEQIRALYLHTSKGDSYLF